MSDGEFVNLTYQAKSRDAQYWDDRAEETKGRLMQEIRVNRNAVEAEEETLP